uniref:Phosphoglycerate mutase gpmB n=1 Tax=Arundo donax TaxID=35708 RepID=A0A0A9E921_ARUDO
MPASTMVLKLELGRGLITTKGILQDTGLLKVTDVSTHLDNATASGTRHKDDAY